VSTVDSSNAGALTISDVCVIAGTADFIVQDPPPALTEKSIAKSGA